MKSRFFSIISIALFALSCSHFVNLGDDDAFSADNTEGLPDELSEDRADTAEDASYDDWNEDYDNPGSDAGSDAAPETDPVDPTEELVDDDPGSIEPSEGENEAPDEDPYIFPESGDPFPEGFSNVECGCGSTPDYAPVCCDGMISVFNACFANCYAVNSGNKICSFYETGLCGGTGITKDLTEGDGEPAEPSADEDDETDDDTELPDEDADPAEITNECGCYPEEEASIFRCGGSFYFITECLANCHCENPEKLF